MDMPITFESRKPLKGRPLDVFQEIDLLEKDRLIYHMSDLHFAASIGPSPKNTKYLLEFGADADEMCDFRTWKRALFAPSYTRDIFFDDLDEDHEQDFSHIDLILDVLANDFDLYKRTKRTTSIFELLLHLCYTLRKSMEVLRLLVQHTQRTQRLTQQFVNYAQKGKLVHLAALVLAAPELFLTPSLAGVECPCDKLYKHRAHMDEGLSLLLDVFAVVGPKLVAYLRIDFPTMQSGRLPSMEIASFFREVARKRGVPSPDDYLLRLFKCDEVPEKFVDADYPKAVMDDLVPCLEYDDIDQAYIDRVLPDLKPDEQVYLNRAMEIKLSSMPIMRGLHEGITTVTSPIMPAGRIFGSGKRSIRTYSTCANHRTVLKFTSPYNLGNNVMKLTNPKFISTKLCVIAKRLIK